MITDKSKKTFEALIASSISDAGALTALEAQLRAMSEPWAGPMRIKVIDLRRKLAARSLIDQVPTSGAPLPPAKAAAPNGLTGWGTPFGLPPPDGRPLYQYRLASPSFAVLEIHLKSQRRPDGFARYFDEAL